MKQILNTNYTTRANCSRWGGERAMGWTSQEVNQPGTGANQPGDETAKRWKSQTPNVGINSWILCRLYTQKLIQLVQV